MGSEILKGARGANTLSSVVAVACCVALGMVAACDAGTTSSSGLESSGDGSPTASESTTYPLPDPSPTTRKKPRKPPCLTAEPTPETNEFLVYWPCGNTHRPVVASAGIDPWAQAIDVIRRGPDRRMRSRGFYAAVDTQARFTVVRRSARVIVDFDSDSINTTLFLESPPTLRDSLELTLEGIAKTDLRMVTLIDGKGLCTQPEAPC